MEGRDDVLKKEAYERLVSEERQENTYRDRSRVEGACKVGAEGEKRDLEAEEEFLALRRWTKSTSALDEGCREVQRERDHTH